MNKHVLEYKVIYIVRYDIPNLKYYSFVRRGEVVTIQQKKKKKKILQFVYLNLTDR